MRDRLSTKILSNGATRYGVYDETGNLLRYEYIKLEDEPTVEGDLFSKANMLPDSIPAALGLKMSNPQVKDALNVLANIGNVHVWQRVQTYADPVPEVPAGYTLGEVNNNVPIVTLNDGYNYLTEIYITVAAALSVTQDGNISLSNATTNRYNLVAWTERDDTLALLAGNFVMIEESSEYNTPYLNTILFVPADATITGDKDRTITLTKVQSVTGYPYTPAIPAGTTTDYLTSTDPNAYPKRSAEGGQDAYYTLGDVEVGSFNLSSENNTAANITFYKSASVSVADDGTLSLISPTSQRFQGSQYLSNADAFLENAKGSYIMTNSSECGFLAGEVYFIPSDAEGSYNSPGWYLTKRQKVTGHAAIPPNTTITYLGQLGELGAKIEVGSYVGTGTSSATITLGYQADFLAVFYKDRSGTDLYYHGFALPNFPWSTSNITMLAITNTGFTVRYNAYGSLSYLNSSGATYVYIAFRKG